MNGFSWKRLNLCPWRVGRRVEALPPYQNTTRVSFLQGGVGHVREVVWRCIRVSGAADLSLGGVWEGRSELSRKLDREQSTLFWLMSLEREARCALTFLFILFLEATNPWEDSILLYFLMLQFYRSRFTLGEGAMAVNSDRVGKCLILEAKLLIEETLNNISFFSKSLLYIPICLTLFFCFLPGPEFK